MIADLGLGSEDVLIYEVMINTDPYSEMNFGLTAASEEVSTKKNLELKKKLRDLETKRMGYSLPEVIGEEFNRGLTGLSNLGNTCFMNSVLQCLSSTEPITKFFLLEVYKLHVNTKNNYGTKGKLAVEFSELLQSMYLGKDRSVAPWGMKHVVAMKASQFDGFAQHDSQEMLSVLLETLHEDVNSVSKKPYVEYKDSENRTDEEISNEYWQGFLKREKSIFVDLFYGQLKSRVQCS